MLLALALMQSLPASTSTITVDPWAIAGRVGTMFSGIVIVVGVFTWRTLTKAVFALMLKYCSDDVKKVCDELYQERDAKTATAVDTVGVLADKVEFLEAAIVEQGKALSDSLSDAVRAQTTAMEKIADNSASALKEMTRLLERVADDTASNSTAIAGIEGYLRAPNATLPERRKRQRRKPT